MILFYDITIIMPNGHHHHLRHLDLPSRPKKEMAFDIREKKL